jgi:hypothetical protein
MVAVALVPGIIRLRAQNVPAPAEFMASFPFGGFPCKELDSATSM